MEYSKGRIRPISLMGCISCPRFLFLRLPQVSGTVIACADSPSHVPCDIACKRQVQLKPSRGKNGLSDAT